MVIEWVILDKLPFLTNDEGIKVKSVFESLYLYLQNKQFWQYDISFMIFKEVKDI
jgi:hypothetical protein